MNGFELTEIVPLSLVPGTDRFAVIPSLFWMVQFITAPPTPIIGHCPNNTLSLANVVVVVVAGLFAFGSLMRYLSICHYMLNGGRHFGSTLFEWKLSPSVSLLLLLFDRQFCVIVVVRRRRQQQKRPNACYLRTLNRPRSRSSPIEKGGTNGRTSDQILHANLILPLTETKHR